MSEIPEWAMQKARDIWYDLFAAEGHADGQSAFNAIASALMEADREGTERCAEIAATAELYSGDHLINSDPRVTIASAIRKGDHHD